MYPIKILVCGGRDVTEESKIRRFVNLFPSGTIVITGGARGADSIAYDAAAKRGLVNTVYMADWTAYDKAAGHIRNRQMLNKGPDLVIAFYQEEIGRGTADMIRQAQQAGVPVLIYKA